MVRYLIIALVLVFSSSLFSQNKEIVFLNRSHVAWHAKEVIEFEKAYAALTRAIDTKSPGRLHNASQDVEGSFRRFDANGLKIYERMMYYLDQQELKRKRATIIDGGDILYDLEIARARKANLTDEAMLSLEDAELYLQNLATIKNVRDALQKDYSRTALKADGLAKIKSAISAARENDALLQRAAI